MRMTFKHLKLGMGKGQDYFVMWNGNVKIKFPLFWIKNENKTLRVLQKAALNTSLCCQFVNLFLLKIFTKIQKQNEQKIDEKNVKESFFHNLRFRFSYNFSLVTICCFEVCHNLIFWVWSPFQILSFVQIWVLS